MTFYIRVKEAVPQPVLIKDRCFLTYGAKVAHREQTLEVEKGATVGANYGVVNNGGSGKVAVQLWDTRSNKEVARKEYYLEGGEQRIEGFTFTANADMDLVYYALYWDGSKWVQADVYGSPGSKVDIIGYLREG